MKTILSHFLSNKSALVAGLLSVSIFSSQNMIAQDSVFDNRTKPAPLEEVTFEFPEYNDFTLDNGLRVFVIEDNEAPIVEFRLLMPGGSAYDAIPGQADFLATLLTKGYGDVNARKFAKMMDGKGISIGASAGTESFSISGNSLVTHQDIMWDGLKGILTKPALPEDELDKLKPQAMANLKSQKGSPGAMASKLSRKVIFGNNHPYAQFMDEADVEKMEIADVKRYFDNFIKPDGASLLVVGDIQTSKLKSKLNLLLKGWSGSAEGLSATPAPASEPLGVYFISRPGSVQSSVRYLSPATNYIDKDREVLHLASGVISGGFSGRLFKTLREKHSYTYSPTGTLTSYKLFNYLMAGSDVRNEVTDSAIVVIQAEINDLAKSGPSDTELNIMKMYQIGNYNMSFEDPSFAGYVIQNAFFKGQTLEYAKGFTKRKAGMTPSKVKSAVRKYLLPSKSYLVVVGDPSVRESLTQFGKIYDYNTDIMPISGEDAVMKEIDDSPSDIIEDYIDAIGGDLSKVKSLQSMGSVELTIGGQTYKGKITANRLADGRFFKELSLPVFERRMVYDGKTLKAINNGLPEIILGPEKESVIIEENIFLVSNLKNSAAKLETLGEQNGKKLVRAIYPNGKSVVFYFDKDTDLLDKYSETLTTPQGVMEAVYNFSEYTEVEGIKLPKKTYIESTSFNNTMILDYQINEDYDETLFELN